MTMMNIPMARRAMAFVSSHSKSLTLGGLSLLIFVHGFIAIRTQFSGQDFGLDRSWLLELGYQLAQGNLLGRDVYFTYGPLAQWIVEAGVRLQGSGSLLNSLATINFIGTIISVALLAFSLGLMQEVQWADALFIFLTMFLINLLFMSMMRPLALLLGMVLFVQVLRLTSAWRYGGASLVGLFWFMGQLISADVGLYAVASALGFILVGVGVASLPLERWGLPDHLLPRRIYLETFAISLTTFVICWVALEIFFHFSSATYQWFDYIRYNFDSLVRYNYAMGVPWMNGLPPENIFSPMLFLVIAYTSIYSLVTIIRSWRAGKTQQVHLLLGVLITAGITLKSAIVRSDLIHILLGSALFIFLFLLSLCWKKDRTFFPLTGRMLLVMLLMAWPAGNGLNALMVLTRLGLGQISLVEKWHQIRGTQVDPQELISPELRAAIDPEKSIINFPYDNVLAIALNQKSLAPVLQTYAAFNESLQQKYVQEVARQPANVEIIFGIDGPGAWSIDGVQNISRVPIIFKYFVENFRLKTSTFFNGRIILEARTDPRPLSLLPLPYELRNPSDPLDLWLPQPTNCALIELELFIHYPSLAFLGRPTRPVIQLWNGETEVVNNRLVAIETSRKFSTFIYLGNPESFPGLFADSGEYKIARTFDHLRLSEPDYSLFDIYPNRITLGRLQCLP